MDLHWRLKVLTADLREFERAGITVRIVYPIVPLQISIHSTRRRKLAVALNGLAKFGMLSVDVPATTALPRI